MEQMSNLQGMTCPKCGAYNANPTREPLEECPACGVIYSKAIPRQAPNASKASPRQRRDLQPREAGALLILGGFAVAVGAIWMYQPADIRSARRAEILSRVDIPTPVERSATQSAQASGISLEHAAELATLPCKDAIESQASYDTKFNGIFNTLMLTQGRRDAPNVFTFFGDDIQMQNGFGAWRKMKYLCTYRVETNKAVALVVPL